MIFVPNNLVLIDIHKKLAFNVLGLLIGKKGCEVSIYTMQDRGTLT